MNLPTFFFKYRSYTPIPLILVLLYQARPRLPWLLIGIGLLLLGEGIRFWAILYAGGATRTRQVGANELVSSGPYGYVRNPLYLGNMLIYGGVVFIAGGPWMWEMLVVAIVFFTFQYSLIISLEEDKLHELFGEAYAGYSAHVPRIIPRLTPWRKTGRNDVQPLSIEAAFRPEKSTLLNIGIMLILIAGKWLFLQM
ncbi:MAG: isoprenylcysteine carboxylmethyltransferase family protein [Calditrichota bacterium]